jgi:hypothetical protein
MPTIPSYGAGRAGAAANMDFGAQQDLLGALQLAGHVADQEAGSLVADISGGEGLLDISFFISPILVYTLRSAFCRI